MERLSYRYTKERTRDFAIAWFGFLSFVIILGLWEAVSRRALDRLPLLAIPLVLMVFGYSMMKRFDLDLVEEVWDGGDELVVRHNGVEDRMRLRDVASIEYDLVHQPARVTVELRAPGRFGGTIVFSPPRRFPWFCDPVIDRLIARVKRETGITRR